MFLDSLECLGSKLCSSVHARSEHTDSASEIYEFIRRQKGKKKKNKLKFGGKLAQFKKINFDKSNTHTGLEQVSQTWPFQKVAALGCN